MARISIILPNYNSDRHLRSCIEAFLSQDHPEKRLLIVDGKSTDLSHDIIGDFAEKYGEIEWIRKPDTGISNALNMGIDRLRDDEIFGFLGADDILLPGALAKTSEFMRDSPDAIGVYFDSYTQNAKGERKLRECPAAAMTMDALLRYRTIAGLQNIYLRADLAKRYGFNTDARYSMDYELYLRLARDGLGERFLHIARPSTINISDGNISTSFRRASKREALKFAYNIAPFGWHKIRIGLRRLR